MVAVGESATRRKTDAVALEVVREMREWFSQHEIAEDRKFEAMQFEIRDDRRTSEERHKDLVTRMEHMSQSMSSVVSEQNRALKEIHCLFQRAFPKGDAEEHRKAHEAWIKKAEEEAQFWLKLKQHTINWAVVAILGWGGIILWAAFIKGPK